MGDAMNESGRDKLGWFTAGNRIAVGNRTRRMQELRRALLDCATEDDVRELYRGLLKSARDGDTAAAKVLLEHLVGRPSQQVELSGPDGRSLGPDVAGLAVTILAALAPYPEARFAVAARLKLQAPESHASEPRS
jgi:hypothetical protein